MEKFIETMPTMIQTHLIICKDWAETKDKAKSLEHIIRKCDPPTPAMPLVTTGATVLGLYSHIAHSVDKDEAEIPPSFKGAKPKQTRGRGKPKGNPQGHRQNPLKDQEADKAYTYNNTNNCYHNDHYTAPSQNLLLAKAVADNLEASHSEAEARDLSTINVNFRTTGFREAHIRVAVINTAATANPISRKINLIPTEDEAVARLLNKRGRSRGRANYQSNNNNYQYQYYTHDQQMEQYGPPCSLCGSFNHSLKHCYKGGEHDINNIMEKMSINPHHQQQDTLYQ